MSHQEPAVIQDLSVAVPADARLTYAEMFSSPVAPLTQLIDDLDAVREQCEGLADLVVEAEAEELAMRHDVLNVTLLLGNIHSAQDKAKREVILGKALRSRKLPLGIVARRIIEARASFAQRQGTFEFWRTRLHDHLNFEIETFLLSARGAAAASTDACDPVSVGGLVHRLRVAYEHRVALYEAKDVLEKACHEYCKSLYVQLCLMRATNLAEAAAKVGFLADWWREAHLQNARVYTVCEIVIRTELERWHGVDSPSGSSGFN